MADLRDWCWCEEVRRSLERKRCGIWRSFLWCVDTEDEGLGRRWRMRCGGGFRGGGRFGGWRKTMRRGDFGRERFHPSRERRFIQLPSSVKGVRGSCFCLSRE